MNLFELYAKIGLDDSEYKTGVKSVMSTSKNVEKAIKSLESPFSNLEKTVNAVTHPVQTLEDGFKNLKERTEAIRHPIQTLKNKIEESTKALKEQRERMQELARNFDTAKAKVKELQEAYSKSKKETGEKSKETKKLSKELNGAKLALLNARNAVEKYAKEINDAKANTKNFAKSCEEAAKGAAAIEKGVSTIGKGIATGIGAAVAAGTAVVGTFLSIESATEELRIAQNKTNTAFETAGFTAEASSKTFKEFYRILGDYDTAAEASQLLSRLALNEQDLSKWTNIATGVMATFGDALPVETLIESANETARTGQVTGTLADALNWGALSGERFGVTLKANTKENEEWNKAVSEATSAEEFFNLALQECSTEAERNELILDALTRGYDRAAGVFKETNAEIMAGRDAQLRLQTAMAKVGDEVTRLKTDLLIKFAPAIEKVAGKVADFISKIDVDEVIESVTNAIERAVEWWSKWGPLIVGVATAFVTLYGITKVLSLIHSVTSAIKGAGGVIALFGKGIAALGGPIGIAIAVIAGLVAAIIYLWNTSDEFRAAVSATWESITTAISNAGASINHALTVSIPQAIADFVMACINGVTSVINYFADMAAGIRESVSHGIQGLRDMASGYEELKKDITAKINAIKTGIVNGLNSAKKTVTNILDNIKNAFRNSMENAYNAVQSAIQKIKNVFNFSWSLPRPRIPQIVVTGYSNVLGAQIPHFGIQWFAKAMNRAMVLDGATIFGSMGGNLLGGGEKGREVISGESHLMDMIQSSVMKANKRSTQSGNSGVTNHFHITVNGSKYEDLDTLADDLMIAMQNAYDRRALTFG